MIRTHPRTPNAAASLALALALTLAGCGGHAAQSDYEAMSARTAGGEVAPGPEPVGSVEDYEQRIADYAARLQTQLGVPGADLAPQQAAPAPQEDLQSLQDLEASDAPAPSPQAGPPPPSRCELAADLRDRICELASRICALAGRDPQQAEPSDRCEAANAACEQARADVGQACGG